MATIWQKIEVILKEELRAYDANGRNRGGLGSFNYGLPNEWRYEGQVAELISSKSSRDVLYSKNADLLLKLYSSLGSTGERGSFKEFLYKQLIIDSPYVKITYIIVFVLYRIDELVPGVSFAKRLIGDSVNAFDNVCGMLALIIKYEYSFLSEKDYNDIEYLLGNIKEYDFWIRDRLNNAKYKILEISLSDINPEINTDRNKIINLWEVKFGKSVVPNLIKEIEELFREGDFNEVKYAICVDRVRALLIDVLKKIAVEHSKEKKDDKIVDSAKDREVLNYLKEIGFLNENEGRLADSIYKLTSEEGAHKTITLKEYARITKNIAYEFILLVLDKFSKK